MARKFAKIAFTPEVKAMQEHYGSRNIYARFEGDTPSNDRINPDIAAFIAARDGFYLGTTSSNGWPYIQFRGGSTGFLKVLDEQTLGFADFQGNLQYISVGNLSTDDRVFLFLMDYAHRRRLKIWGRAKVIENDPELLQQLIDPNYPAEVGRAILIHVEAWDWNCPQHIPIRYSEAEVRDIVRPLQERIAQLEAHLQSSS
ncbi:pyridoxamine 5'-phosphate oxidase family protein [Aetokthonos hydrillicola Thurmond2011]|jgi:hypothetical protein|uniref:Pyridoxamine 5'-phosphate oxidase family protein n=1 Tax=Aetokthonos hydrillicola Thurmond2011 TaxID=2712845 RepID=A0AAP5IEF7_9CYAN|nr:pyridoxamine 5'-phosphate oxidase family protein [Aetokthonos hydrillicola]MBO3457210.1 pyridoxamine 5'-phosphate oxidase family protein [Aetokthonos hydrillicola CCALA 1050]MBW4587560.1 pyridoxamine 5'-phosphate oxidase family protein [Aetokthonos hydrillicola CCALA 1050]MDR9900175.1 pyridoxamine 5'-phosphate oxidase family protein [Aetokthonos hydrillicola Thurmond2011]